MAIIVAVGGDVIVIVAVGGDVIVIVIGQSSESSFHHTDCKDPDVHVLDHSVTPIIGGGGGGGIFIAIGQSSESCIPSHGM